MTAESYQFILSVCSEQSSHWSHSPLRVLSTSADHFRCLRWGTCSGSFQIMFFFQSFPRSSVVRTLFCWRCTISTVILWTFLRL